MQHNPMYRNQAAASGRLRCEMYVHAASSETALPAMPHQSEIMARKKSSNSRSMHQFSMICKEALPRAMERSCLKASGRAHGSVQQMPNAWKMVSTS